MFVVLAFGCGSSSNWGDPPGTSGAQVAIGVQARSAPRGEVWVVIVDDTAMGADLRAQVADAFSAYDAALQEGLGSCGSAADAADYEFVDRSLIVVYPSQHGDARFLSAAQQPALRWQSEHKQESDRLLWVQAVRDALETVPIPSSGFRPLEALSSINGLLSGQQAPQDSAELALLASLPVSGLAGIILAVASEDASAASAESYALSDSDSLFLVSAIVPPLDETCSVPSPRFASWAAAQGGVRPQLWSCGTVEPLPVVYSDCFGRAPTSSTVVGTDGGQSECRAMSEVDAAAPCPAEIGWLDPLDGTGKRTPHTHLEGALTVRDCEIRQLSGAALEACRTSLDCAACDPGWCMTEVPSLTRYSSAQSADGTVIAPRFVLGSNHATSLIRLTCNLAGTAPASGGQ
ncbi:MAG: hypothetical protein ABI627_16360 [Polyangiaceae bacterium]